MKKEMNKLIFLDKAVIFLKNNLTKSRSQVEEGLEDIVKQSILKYLTNRIGYNKSEINNITVNNTPIAHMKKATYKKHAYALIETVKNKPYKITIDYSTHFYPMPYIK